MSTLAMEGLTQETIERFTKAASSGILAQTGIQGVDLSGLVSLVPSNTPARNNTSAFPRRKAPVGAQTATWRALLNVNSQQTDSATGLDYAGALTVINEQDCFAPFRPFAKGNTVTLDAVAQAQGFADALAVSELQTLIDLFNWDDIHIINSQAWSLGTAPTPSLAAATTGGSIAASTGVYVRCAVRSGMNYYAGGASAVGAAANLTVGAGTGTNAVTASVPAVKGGVAYDWYVGSSATPANQYYYTTTTIASVNITSIPVAANSLPYSLVDLSAATPAANAGAATTDNSYNAGRWVNGLIASTLGDYGTAGPVTPGSGSSTGATFIDYGGQSLASSGSSITLLDQINDSVWASGKISPTAYMVNSKQGDEISSLVLNSSASTTFLPPTDADARTNLAGGGFIGRYINKAAGGVAVPIEVHPHVPPGTMIARTDRVPFPGANISTVFEWRYLYDTQRFEYAASRIQAVAGGGPRYDYEIRSEGTLINRAPGLQAVATNIA